MNLQIRAYAGLRRYLPDAGAHGRAQIDLPEGATIEDALRAAGVPTHEVKLAFVNGVGQSMSWELKDGDEIGVFPPIAGGSFPAG